MRQATPHFATLCRQFAVGWGIRTCWPGWVGRNSRSCCPISRREGGEGDTEEFAIVRDMSVGGVGILAEKPFLPGTLLIVEPLSVGTKTLLARVIYSAPAANGWQHGCSLSNPLDGEDLNLWVS